VPFAAQGQTPSRSYSVAEGGRGFESARPEFSVSGATPRHVSDRHSVELRPASKARFAAHSQDRRQSRHLTRQVRRAF